MSKKLVALVLHGRCPSGRLHQGGRFHGDHACQPMAPGNALAGGNPKQASRYLASPVTRDGCAAALGRNAPISSRTDDRVPHVPARPAAVSARPRRS